MACRTRHLYQTQDQHQQKRSDSPLYVFCPDCIMSQDAPAQLQRALELIDAEYKSVPSGEQMSSKLKDKFASTFANPPIKELEYLLQSAGCNLEDADGDMVTSLELETVRALLFQPSHSQMRLYPSLLRKLSHIESDTEASEASKFQPLLWAFVYLVHRKSWEFLETFILSGGLLVVSSMLSDENLYCRGQVILCLYPRIHAFIYAYIHKCIHTRTYSYTYMHTWVLSYECMTERLIPFTGRGYYAFNNRLGFA